MSTDTAPTTFPASAVAAEEIARHRAEGLWRVEESIHDDLRRRAETHPDRPAITCWHADGSAPDSLTYSALLERVERVAAGLTRLGVARGEVVTVQLPNTWHFVAVVLACARIGAVAGPMLPIMRRREATFMTGLTESPVYLGPVEHRGFSHAQLSAEVAAEVPTLRHRVLVGAGAARANGSTDPGLDGALDFDEILLGDVGDTELDAPARGDETAYVMFTSGTTGEPKGVLHTHDTLYATCRTQALALGLREGLVTAMGSPNTHNAGYTWNLAMPLVLGGTSHHIDVWDAPQMLAILEEAGVEFFMGAPTFLVDLIGEQERAARDLSALEYFATGSAPIPPVLVEQARDVLGVRVFALWGMTENGCVTVTRPEDPPMRAAESDGSAVHGMELRIVTSDGRPVVPGEIGKLQVRGATQCRGYFRRPELYAESLVDGWFDTGDLARDDGYGGIRIAGREKDVIRRGAEQVPVVEVEAALMRHPRIRDVAVVGYPDERLGERGCAVLVAAGDEQAPDLAAVQEHLDGLGMAKQYWPERVETLPDLPRTPGGKVQKFKLRDELFGG